MGLGLGRTATGQAAPASAGEAGSVRVVSEGFWWEGSWEESRRSQPARGPHTLSGRASGFLGSFAGNGNKRCRNASGASLSFSGFPVGSQEYQQWRNGIPARGRSRDSWARVLWSPPPAPSLMGWAGGEMGGMSLARRPEVPQEAVSSE